MQQGSLWVVAALSVLTAAACGSSNGSTGTGGSSSTSSTTGSGGSSSTTSGTGGSTSTTGSGGSGGEASLGDAPHTIVYAGTIVGVDLRNTTMDSFSGLGMTSYTASADEHPEIGTSQAKDTSGDAFVFLGRWAGGTTAGKFYNAGNMGLLDLPADGGFQYAIGHGSDPIPSTGATAYMLKSQTTATVSDGSLAPGTITGSVAADLAGATTKVGFSITLDIPGDGTYKLESTGGTANVGTSESMIIPNVKGAFIASFPITNPGGACQAAAQCNGAVYGFMAGPNAERIALVAHVYAGAGGTPKSVSGALLFTR